MALKDERDLAQLTLYRMSERACHNTRVRAVLTVVVAGCNKAARAENASHRISASSHLLEGV